MFAERTEKPTTPVSGKYVDLYFVIHKNSGLNGTDGTQRNANV